MEQTIPSAHRRSHRLQGRSQHIEDRASHVEPAPFAFADLRQQPGVHHGAHGRPRGGVADSEHLLSVSDCDVGRAQHFVHECQRLGVVLQKLLVLLADAHDLSCLSSGGHSRLLNAPEEEEQPALPVALGAHAEQRVVVVAAVCLDVRRQVELISNRGFYSGLSGLFPLLPDSLNLPLILRDMFLWWIVWYISGLLCLVYHLSGVSVVCVYRVHLFNLLEIIYYLIVYIGVYNANHYYKT